jgi:hypothetical protein
MLFNSVYMMSVKNYFANLYLFTKSPLDKSPPK